LEVTGKLPKFRERPERSADAKAGFILSGRFWAYRFGISRSFRRARRKPSCDYVYDTTETILTKSSPCNKMFLLNNNLLAMLP